MNVRLSISVILMAVSALSCKAQTPERPNVLVIIADDLGWNDVGFHSKSATTPHLDRFAKEGIELQRFYTYAVCSPARAGLLTGQMPRRFGITHVVGPQQPGLPRDVATLPETFRAAGYRTSLIGKWHLGKARGPSDSGFDHFYGFMGAEIDYFKHTAIRSEQTDWQRNGKTVVEEGYSTDLLADEAVRLLQEQAKGRPFYMQVAFNAPHIPLAAPESFVEKHKNGGGLYAAVIDAMDSAIGRILAELDRQKLRDNTLVVFFSDNGADLRLSRSTPLSRGKDTIYEGGIHTPCVIRWPGRVAAGATSKQPVSVQDLFPTLAGAAGLKLPT
ncbi:MAG TPA: arylsulfatase, partial [Verrucomicrobiales bacterium]|nr:arylsulfatase [Verrucomicrobiales bacterium]